MFGVACVLIIKKWRLPVALLFGDSRHRAYIDYRASPFSRVRVKFALNGVSPFELLRAND